MDAAPAVTSKPRGKHSGDKFYPSPVCAPATSLNLVDSAPRISRTTGTWHMNIPEVLSPSFLLSCRFCLLSWDFPYLLRVHVSYSALAFLSLPNWEAYGARAPASI